MSELNSLLQRIDAEFSAVESRIRTQQGEHVREYEGRRQRLEQLDKVFNQLRDIWKPRLEALAKKFGDKAEVTPVISPSSREATFKFQSSVARIVLRFSAATDRDVRNVTLGYDLDIAPILMQFDSHSELSLPLDQVDPKKVTDWIDDRIVNFVKTYLTVHENNLYLKDAMVEDPIANVSFPKYAAATKLEHGGKTYYFIGDETRREFEQKQGINSK